MIRTPTVFVLGAGFSAELGLPMGSGLKAWIRKLAQELLAKGIRDRAGDQIYKALGEDLPRVRRTMEKLANALERHPSIDALVHHFEADQDLSLAARIAISAALLGAEAGVTWGKVIGPQRKFQPPPLHEITETAAASIFNLIMDGVTLASIDTAFRDVSFVNFNYDRTLEHYFFHALMQRSQLAPGSAAAIVRGIEIARPYGEIGRLAMIPSDVGPEFTSFGDARPDLQRVADGIRTYSEAAKGNVMASARQQLATARRIVFLGCAYHDQNLDLIRLEKPGRNAISVWGTVYGEPPKDPLGHAAIDMRTFLEPRRAPLASKIWDAVGREGIVATQACVLEPLTCHQLVEMHRSSWA